jgi:4-hydroxybenzoate polyprenyltransferase
LKKTWNDLKYLFRLSRPRFWLYLAGPVLVGMVYASSGPSQLMTLENLLLFLYFLLPANIMLYGVNDYFDRDIDQENPKKDKKETDYESRRFTDGVILLSTLAGGSLLALPENTWIWSALFLFLSIEYSAPPFRFKTTPFLDSFSNGLYAVPFVIGFTAVSGNLPSIPTIIGAWLWTMAMHTFSAIPDIEPDREAGIRTTATYLGERKAYLYCFTIWTLSALVFASYSQLLGGLFSVYQVLVAAIYLLDIDISRAYWWYPYINAGAGTAVTIYGLRVLFNV